MPDPLPNPQLLRSLGKLARGLSALFWGLPAALLVSAEMVRTDWLKPFGVLPLLAVNLLVLYGLWQMGEFQRQERPWRFSLDRALLLAMVNLGLSPFIYWHNRAPDVVFFTYSVMLLGLSAIVFLFNLNLLLKRLAEMLPDETLRHETRQFTVLNCWLLVVLLLISMIVMYVSQSWHVTSATGNAIYLISRFSNLLLIFFILLPLAMTMALIWKTKEVILDAVFGARG